MSETKLVVKKPNPQGKGVVPVLADWESVQPAEFRARSAQDFLRDYCLSSLVLAADFKFKPVPGQSYYLYLTQKGWNLSLVAPEEWQECRSDRFLGTCSLRSDMTWKVDVAQLSDDSPVTNSARDFVCAFIQTLTEQSTITEHLPVYARELPYYRRMLAAAMSKSLKQSLPPGGDHIGSLLAAKDPLMALTK